MASFISSLRASQCMSCVRRVQSGAGEPWLASAQQQIRGKKKLAKTPSTVTVRLLRDVKGYGKAGTILPLQVGRMRNEFFPRRMADYTSPAVVKQMIAEGKLIERDYTFGLQHFEVKKQIEVKKQSEDSTSPAPRKAKVELGLPEVEKSTATIEKLLPASLEFARAPIVAPETPVQRRSPSLRPLATTTTAAGEATVEGKKAIFGSVSTADIAASIRGLLAEDAEGSRIVLGPEDISFAIATEESDRVKHLGQFDIDIKLKGSSKFVRRAINVVAEDDQA